MPSGSFNCSVGNHADWYQVYVNYSYTQNAISNTSSFSATLYLKQLTNSYDFTSNSATIGLVVGGKDFTLVKNVDIDDKGDAGYTIALNSGSVTVQHNSSGAGSVTVSVNCNLYGAGWGPGTVTGSKTIDLNRIDRTAPSVSFSMSDIKTSSVLISASANANCDRWWYSTNSGSSWVLYSSSNTSSAKTTITGLKPSTTYSIKIAARKTSNQVEGQSAVKGITTAEDTPGAPTSISANGVDTTYTDGNPITISWLGAKAPIQSYELQCSIKPQKSSLWGSWSTLTTIVTTATSGSYTDFSHKSLLAGDQIKYRVRAKNGIPASSYLESNVLTRLGGIRTNASGSWKLGTVWINSSGTWKQAACVWHKPSEAWVRSK